MSTAPAVLDRPSSASPVLTPLWVPAGTTDFSPVDRWLAESSGWYALDTETTGLNPLAHGFRCRQLALGCSDGSSVVVDGGSPPLVRLVLRMAFDGGRKWFAHNANYDAWVLWACYGVRAIHLLDALTGARCAWPGRLHTSYSLKVLQPETEHELMELRAHWEVVGGHKLGKQTDKSWLPKAIAGLPADDPFVLRYVATDAVACARLADRIGALPPQATVTPQGSSKIILQSRKAVNSEVLHDALWRHVPLDGILVDRDGLRAKRQEIEAEIMVAREHYGLDLSKNSNATRQWVAELGIICQDLKGKDTLSHDAWDDAVVPESAVREWADFRAVRTASTDLNKVNELLVCSSADGRIHPFVGVNAAGRTGRMSISGPAVQNLTAGLREYLLADDGRALVGLDLDQVEPRVAAGLSQDPKMHAAVTSGDPYVAAAQVIWLTPPEDASEMARRRKIAKTILLAQLYGQGVASLAVRLGLSVEEARRIRSTLLAEWPGLRSWLTGIRTRAERGELVMTWGGRSLPDCSDVPYKLVNYVVQGSAADVFKVMVSAVARKLPSFGGSRLWLPVHDELVVECAEGDAEDVAAMMGETMRVQVGDVPVGGKPAVLGRRWLHA